MQATAIVADERPVPAGNVLLPATHGKDPKVQFALEQALIRFAESRSADPKVLREKFVSVQRLGVDLKAPQFKPAARDTACNLTLDGALTAGKAQVLREVFGLSETEVQAIAIKALKTVYQSGKPPSATLAVVKSLGIPEAAYSGVATKEDLFHGIRRTLKHIKDYERSYQIVKAQVAFATELGVSKKEFADAGLPDLIVYAALQLDQDNKGEDSVRARFFELARQIGAREELFWTKRAVDTLNSIDWQTLRQRKHGRNWNQAYNGGFDPDLEDRSDEKRVDKLVEKRCSKVDPRSETEIYAKARHLAAMPDPVIVLPPRLTKVPTEDEIMEVVVPEWDYDVIGERERGISMLKEIFKIPGYKPSPTLQEAALNFVRHFAVEKKNLGPLCDLEGLLAISKEFKRQLYIERYRLNVSYGRPPEMGTIEDLQMANILLEGKPLTREETDRATFEGILIATRLSNYDDKFPESQRFTESLKGAHLAFWDGKNLQHALELYPIPEKFKDSPELEAAACAMIKYRSIRTQPMGTTPMLTVFAKLPIRPEARTPLAASLLREYLSLGRSEAADRLMMVAPLPKDLEQRIRKEVWAEEQAKRELAGARH